jgi:hypothetical protein
MSHLKMLNQMNRDVSKGGDENLKSLVNRTSDQAHMKSLLDLDGLCKTQDEGLRARYAYRTGGHVSDTNTKTIPSAAEVSCNKGISKRKGGRREAHSFGDAVGQFRNPMKNLGAEVQAGMGRARGAMSNMANQAQAGLNNMDPGAQVARARRGLGNLAGKAGAGLNQAAEHLREGHAQGGHAGEREEHFLGDLVGGISKGIGGLYKPLGDIAGTVLKPFAPALKPFAKYGGQLGSLAGTIGGGMVGGPAGAMIGGGLGGMAGDMVGGKVNDINNEEAQAQAMQQQQRQRPKSAYDAAGPNDPRFHYDPQQAMRRQRGY